MVVELVVSLSSYIYLYLLICVVCSCTVVIITIAYTEIKRNKQEILFLKQTINELVRRKK